MYRDGLYCVQVLESIQMAAILDDYENMGATILNIYENTLFIHD